MAEWIDINEDLRIRIEVHLVQFSKDGSKYNLFTDDFLNFLKKERGSITIPEVSSKGFLILNRDDFKDCNFYYSLFEQRRNELLAPLIKEYQKKNRKLTVENPSEYKKNKILLLVEDEDDIEEDSEDVNIENDEEFLRYLGDYCLWLYRSD